VKQAKHPSSSAFYAICSSSIMLSLLKVELKPLIVTLTLGVNHLSLTLVSLSKPCYDTKGYYLLLLCLLHVLLVAIVVDGPIVMGFDMNGFYFVALVNFLGISHCFED
jgi:hypothetical protein